MHHPEPAFMFSTPAYFETFLKDCINPPEPQEKRKSTTFIQYFLNTKCSNSPKGTWEGYVNGYRNKG